MTARFLLQLRQWEQQAMNASKRSKFMINFKTPGDEDEDDEDENDHFDRYQPSTIYNEFGNDPVLEARMGYVDENMREVGTGSARLADR